MTIVDSLLGLVGETSLLKLSRVPPAGGATVWVKLEQQNPGGSVKDRIAVSMLEAALRDGRVARGGTVIEPSALNTIWAVFVPARLTTVSDGGVTLLAVSPLMPSELSATLRVTDEGMSIVTGTSLMKRTSAILSLFRSRCRLLPAPAQSH